VTATRRPGCLRLLVRAALLPVALGLGILAWDIWALRALQPPDERTFEGFLRAGRQGNPVIDKEGKRLYLIAPYPRTIVTRWEPPVYEFDRSGRLVNWMPSGDSKKGMLLEAPVRWRGAAASVDEARAWLRKN
jgi:hypothetical protein